MKTIKSRIHWIFINFSWPVKIFKAVILTVNIGSISEVCQSTFFFLLKYSWLTMLCQTLLYSSDSVICTDTFFMFFSIMVFHRIMNMVSCAIHKDTLDSKILWTCLNITGQTKIIGMRMPMWVWGFPDSSFGKESTCNAGDHGSILGSGSSPGEGIGYLLQLSWPSLVAQL